ncbi:MAG: glycosyltransferase [Gemmatimonadaceae bacterium]
MRVLFLTHSYPRWSGDAAGSFLLRLAQTLEQRGIEVAVVAPSAPGLPLREDVGGIPVIRFRYAPARWETLAYTGSMAEDVKDSWAARLALLGFIAAGTACTLRVQREFSADLLHAHWWFPAGIMGRIASAMAGKPFVVTMHGSDVRLAASIRLARPFFRAVVRSATAVTTVSRWLAEQATALAPGLRTLVEPMPVATELFSGAKSARDPRRILFVGRLNEQKGIARLIEALARVSAPATLDVIGDGPDADVLRTRVQQLGLSDRVRWHGALPQPAIAAFYQRAAVLAVPSLGEGLGLTAVEAQLSGTPVVAFDSGGISDTLRHNETGLLVPPGDLDAFAAALNELITDHGRARAMGEAGARWAIERFSPEVVAAHYAEIYRGALSA